MSACTGGVDSGATGGASTGIGDSRGAFLAVKTTPVNGATIYLNDPIECDFTHRVDIDSATLTTMTFTAFDQTGNPVQEQVTGTFRLSTTPGDLEIGRRLQFIPRIADNNDFSNGGFRSGRSYLVQLVGGSANNGTVLRDAVGRGLGEPVTFRFTTREGTQPQQLYRNPKPGGPARTGFRITTAQSLQNVPVGLFGAPPLEIRLDFDQALNPSSENVPVALDVNPLFRSENDRGLVYLEYKDPVYDEVNDPTDFTWIPAEAEFERNDLTGSTIVLRPQGVLPNNAEIRVIVEPELQDISGENNIALPNYNRVFATFQTEANYDQRWDAVVETFETTDQIDLTASFPEAQADVGPGYVRAGFAFEGNTTTLEYEPTSQEVVLNTAFTQVVPKAGLPFTVTGGVFNFKNVTIPQGVSVFGQGPNPMVWLCSGRFTVAGTLSVRGGNGARVDTLQSANFAKAGGPGVCGGGNGGEGTPSPTLRDQFGGTGRGPLQENGKGGRGGKLACTGGCYSSGGYNGDGGGSGGGGGSMATQGDLGWRGTAPALSTINPNVGAPATSTRFQQLFGYGGAGCNGQSGARSQFLAGGAPGEMVFTDSRQDNNFWGSAIAIRPSGNLRITGELTVPMGGGGGGGGGDTSPTSNCTPTGNDPRNDYSGGGAGGGGGVLIVKALQEITITSTGHIIADGGHGGGGEQVGASGEAGGGGGGAGGMVVLMSAKSIIIEAHGTAGVGGQGRYVYGSPSATSTADFPYIGNDYDFAVSADGGVCLTGTFGQVNVAGKYRPAGQAMLGGDQYDDEPLGGLGGMGIVQLMVPPGPGEVDDDTNTILDDNIHFRLPGQTTNLTGAQKRQLLGWSGFPNTSGIGVDDNGTPTGIFPVNAVGSFEGDIRPSPVLMPVPFNAKSRVRSKWIDTGATQRRELAGGPDGLPRGLDTSGSALVGPTFEFAGIDLNNAVKGYVDYTSAGNAVTIDYPPVGSAVAIADIDASATYLGSPAYLVTLAQSTLPATGEYANYEAEMLNSTSTLLRGFRILAHTQNQLWLDASQDVLPNSPVTIQVRKKFFKVVTSGSEGLGQTYSAVGGPAIPIANVRIGFAFHQDPTPGSLTPGGRFPTSELEFIHDFSRADLQQWIATFGAPRYVQWDVVFDMQYKPTTAQPPALSPSTPRPSLEFLRLPFRF